MSVDNRRTNATNPEGSVADLLIYAELLNTPKLAQLYIYILQHDTVAIETIKDELDLPHATTYKYIGKLEEMDILTRHKEETPTTVNVTPIQLTLDTPHGEVLVTPALVDAVARQLDTEDIRVFVERQGIAKLAAALHYTRRVRDGDLTQRTAAEKLGVHAIEGITVITALQDVVGTATADDSMLASDE
ncbi:DUF7437 domain-containing protein [Halocatena pleomorpha]|uniref:Transcriptional regulator TrmB n=1 Tax=Halocatena pleomorpha TaxID=1785090 RepID=A0A3P3R6T5_9EURY|nr:helix-turn-helix domain-containing protein [Halocatena pleomorpha]RRJ28718.1 transcriptional regulator TrmB [Halocatena pleomorpha]